VHADVVSRRRWSQESGLTQALAVRVGLSDGRHYQEVGKFSIFYQPLRKTWRLIFSADSPPGGMVAWARPVLTRP